MVDGLTPESGEVVVCCSGLVVLEPVVLEPVVLEPVVLEPVVLEPVVLEPVAPDTAVITRKAYSPKLASGPCPGKE
jgi:hypothetical protein